MVQKSFHQPGATLYVVATPIGNLQDISMRAVNIMQKVSYVLCEDTRRTKILLDHLQIKKPMISYHKFNAQTRQTKIINLLTAGHYLALVSDAGTPLISDPGHLIVSAVIKQGFKVVAVGINCAAIHGLVCSGFKSDQFNFQGFLPRTHHQRTKILQQLIHQNRKGPVIFYESRYRIFDFLTNIRVIYPTSKLFLGRELTKINEWMAWGTAEEILKLMETSSRKGEYVVVMELLPTQNQWQSTQFKLALNLLMNHGLQRSKAKNIIRKINFLN